jgi:hypothetical protein
VSLKGSQGLQKDELRVILTFGLSIIGRRGTQAALQIRITLVLYVI